ncbi:methylenetetrahydrofolate reductase [NAD(P)H] [Methylophilaceae bacterium]|nr:methylenetetrahydrofolate reductase [NAD(P)H] [Methylophilaceae bacterium]
MKASSFSFEFFPPRTQEGEEKLKTTLKNLSEFNPEFFSVTFGAGGSTKDKTIGIVESIKDQGYSAVPHISCITSTKDEVLELITSYKNKGIDRLVALRGDNPSGIAGYGDFHYASDLVEFIRKNTGDHFHIDVAAYPEFHPESANSIDDLINFKTKVDAGANSAITQFFFNVDSYFKFIEECGHLNINIPIVPGIMPIYNIKQLSRFAQTCGAEIPRWLKYKLESYGDDIDSLREFGVDFISELCETLQQFGVESFHFYTLNESGIVTKVLKNISN